MQLYYNAIIMTMYQPRNQAPDQAQDQSQGGIQVIARAAAILRILKDATTGMSLGQIAARADLPRSTVQRIVNTLQAERLVFAMPNGGGFRLGPEIQALAAASRLDIANDVRVFIAELAQATGETVDLATLREDRMLFIDQIVGTHRLRAVATIGEHFPLTSTANGKSCLALLDDATVETLVSAEFRTNGRGMRALGQFMGEIDQIRDQGYATDLNEHTDGICAVGAAFRTPDEQLYAVSIPVPSHRFEKMRPDITARLLATVAELREHFSSETGT